MSDNREKNSQQAIKKRNGPCIQIIAWMLLTVGLCIIVTTFYLAIRHQGTTKDQTGRAAHPDYEYSDESNEFESNNSSETSDELNSYRKSYDAGSVNEGCNESVCRILCNRNNKTLYEDVGMAVNSSECSITTSLTLHNLQRHCIGNEWLDSNRTVHKIFISSSKLKKIKSGAFNVPMFAATFLMNWHDLDLESLDSGALLGLYSLKYLNIKTKLPNMDDAFLQPVQTTLMHLRLNAALTFDTNSSLFGNTCFDKLIYLDLSNNNFRGVLNRRLFYTTPNLKYLYINYAKITAIESNTFADLAGKLQVLSLAYNRLTTLCGKVLPPLLNGKTYLELEPNNWRCDCELRTLAEQYANHSGQFMTALYCKWPLELYGNNFDTLNSQQLNCNEETHLDMDLVDDDSNEAESTTIAIHSDSQSSSTALAIVGPILPVRCIGAPVFESTTEYDNSTNAIAMNDSDIMVQYEPSVYLVFEPPAYDLVLKLYADRSVNVTIEAYNEEDNLNVIWFSEHFDDETQSKNSDLLDYNCMSYSGPWFMIDSLNANTTYTFCMVPKKTNKVSPLNCQPLHVPALRQNSYGSDDGDGDGDIVYDDEYLEISEAEKQFTIGILCLIFFISAFVGAVIAYLSIKTYPDLLEGSKNVLVVKKSDKMCYISTISETEQGTKCKLAKRNTLKLSDAASAKKLDRLASVKSSSTIFDDDSSQSSYVGNDYELPKMFDESYYSMQSCVPNAYAMSPGSPPPLPKRNSNVRDSLDANKKKTTENSDN